MKPLTKQILTVIVAFVSFGLVGRFVKNNWIGGMIILLMAGYAGWLIHKYEIEKALMIIKAPPLVSINPNPIVY